MGGNQSKSICQTFVFDAASVMHPGTILLPPRDILSYPTLPVSVMKQISQDGAYYDFYGKLGGAFEDSMIDAPVGSAKFDYEEWLQKSPEVHQEISQKIKGNFDSKCSEEKWVMPDLDHLSKKDMDKLEKITKQLLISMENNENKNIEWPDGDGQQKDGEEKKRNPMSVIADVIQETAFDWKPGATEKDDRNKLIMHIAKVYFKKNVDIVYASSAVVIYLVQYVWKLKHHAGAKFDESTNRLSKIISNTVNQRFILLNRDRMVHFKEKILEDCNKMARIMNNIDFAPIFEKKISQFYKEFEETNMEMVTRVTDKFVNQAMQQSGQGSIFGNNGDVDENSQKLFLEKAMSECDQSSVQIFETLSSKYHDQVKEEMENILFGSLLVNLQGNQPVSFLNLQAFQSQANTVQPLSAPIYLGNLEAINLVQNLQQPAVHSNIYSALY